jgi:hypothetical protein
MVWDGPGAILVHPLISAGEFLLGTAMLAVVAGSVARTVLVPRNRSSRLVRCALHVSLAGARVAARPGCRDGGRPKLVDLVGPVGLAGALLCWLVGLLAGFGLLSAAAGSARGSADPLVALLIPVTAVQDGAVAQAAALGFWLAATAVVIAFGAYLAVIIAAYGRRERLVRQLAAEAVRPPDAEDLIAAYLHSGSHGLDPLLAELNCWFNDIRTSHSAYPVLANLPRNGGLCWLEAMVIALDTAALVDAIAPSRAVPAARALLHSGTACLAELAGHQGVAVRKPVVSLHGREEYDFFDTVNRAVAAGLPAERDQQHAWAVFQDWRMAYAPHASAIAAHLLCYCPPPEPVDATDASRRSDVP